MIIVFCLNVCQIGAFFMINLCLVVIATQFSETKKRETERMAVERARHRRHSRSSSTVTSRASGQAPTAGGCYEELLTLFSHLVHIAQRRAVRLVRICRLYYRRNKAHTAAQSGPLQVYAVTRSGRRRKTRKQRRTRSEQQRAGAQQRRPGEAPYASPELSDIDLTASPRYREKRTTTTSTGVELAMTASTDLLPLRPAFSGSLNEIY